MDLKTYLANKTPQARDEFAKTCGTTRGHLQNVMYGLRPCATNLAVDIERESKREVWRWDLRPNDWEKHWPELVDHKDAPPLPRARRLKFEKAMA